MKQQIDKIKTFVKEHKKEIFIMTTGTIIGVVGGVKLCESMDKNMVKLKWINNADVAKKIIPEVFNKSRFQDFGWCHSDLTIKDLGEYGKELLELYNDITEDTKVNGILVMAD